MQERRVAVVVEDDEDIRGLLEAVLLQSGFDVHPTGLGVPGVELVHRTDPDLVTLDLGLPDIDGFEVARRIRRTSDAHIVMLTARTDEIDTVLGLETGADDYLTKPFSPRELRARVEAIMRRRARKAPSHREPAVPPAGAARPPADTAPQDPGAASATAIRLNGLVLDADMYTLTADGGEIALTPTEFTLLQAILAGGRTIRTKASLYRLLREGDAQAGTYVTEADERSVEVHVGNMRRKLGDDARSPRWIETVRGVGYRAAQPQRADRAEQAAGPATREAGAGPVDPGTCEGDPQERDAVSIEARPGHLEVSFQRGTRLSACHLQLVKEQLVDNGLHALLVDCSGLVSTRSTAEDWSLRKDVKVAYVGVGATDRLLVQFFNRVDTADYAWSYFEDADLARAWLLGSE